MYSAISRRTEKGNDCSPLDEQSYKSSRVTRRRSYSGRSELPRDGDFLISVPRNVLHRESEVSVDRGEIKGNEAAGGRENRESYSDRLHFEYASPRTALFLSLGNQMRAELY